MVLHCVTQNHFLVTCRGFQIPLVNVRCRQIRVLKFWTSESCQDQVLRAEVWDQCLLCQLCLHSWWRTLLKRDGDFHTTPGTFVFSFDSCRWEQRCWINILPYSSTIYVACRFNLWLLKLHNLFFVKDSISLFWE